MNTTMKRFYEVALKSPGLNDTVKMDMRMTKKNFLFLARAIDFVLAMEIKKEEELLALLPPETREELKNVKVEMLKKVDLADFYEELVKIG